MLAGWGCDYLQGALIGARRRWIAAGSSDDRGEVEGAAS